jgi:hypothetical protein
MIQHIPGLLFNPAGEWQKLEPAAGKSANLIYPALMALIPALAWYHGTSAVGWQVGDGETVRLTADSALALIVLFYLAMVTSVVAIGYFIHWMAENYGARSSVMHGITVAGFTSTPLFLLGVIGVLPALSIALPLGILGLGWSLWLLYTGIPVVMHVPRERGFLFASAVVAVCLVILIAIMCGSVILWDMGFAPEYTS